MKLSCSDLVMRAAAAARLACARSVPTGVTAALLVSLPAAVFAAVPVEESVAADPRSAAPLTQPAPQSQSAYPQPRAAAGVGTGPDDSRRLTELFYQLQVLQQEVQELRGLVEEQSHQLNRIARDQQEQYIDLDRRVAGLTTSGAVSSRAPSVSTSPGSTAGSAPRTSGSWSGAAF